MTATDVLSHTVQAQVTFTYDLPPTLAVTAPLVDAVATPDIQLVASCSDSDPGGCTSLWVTTEPPNLPCMDQGPIASGGATLNQTVSLASYNGNTRTLCFYARDAAGLETFQSVPIWVDSSTKLTSVESVPGIIWDVQPTNILYLNQSGGSGTLEIRNHSTGQDTVVPVPSGYVPTLGYLTPGGAIFEAQTGDITTAQLYDWENGTLTGLGMPVDTGSLWVAGNYALWNGSDTGQALYLRDLLAGTNVTVATQAGNLENDVAADGDVVYYSTSYNNTWNIFRYRQGSTSQITYDTTLWDVDPVTDGINIVYEKETPCCTNQTHSIALWDGTAETILAPMSTQEVGVYEVSNGWVAFGQPAADGTSQVWVRSPSGQLSQVTVFGTSSWIDTLGSNGQVTFINSGNRYLGGLGATAEEISTELGHSVYQSGQWFVFIGGVLFQVMP